MSYLITLFIFALCFSGMALGVIFAKKVLRKGCSVDPADPNSTCACKNQGPDSPETTDDVLQLQPGLKPKNNKR